MGQRGRGQHPEGGPTRAGCPGASSTSHSLGGSVREGPERGCTASLLPAASSPGAWGADLRTFGLVCPPTPPACSPSASQSPLGLRTRPPGTCRPHSQASSCPCPLQGRPSGRHQSPCAPRTSLAFSNSPGACCSPRASPHLHPESGGSLAARGPWPGAWVPRALSRPSRRSLPGPPTPGDTVATDEQNDEINAHEHPRVGRAAVGHDPAVHHGVPVLARQDLGGRRSGLEGPRPTRPLGLSLHPRPSLLSPWNPSQAWAPHRGLSRARGVDPGLWCDAGVTGPRPPRPPGTPAPGSHTEGRFSALR